MLENATPFMEALEARDDGALRAFDWAELVARIAATNDLRRVVAQSSHSGGFANLATGSHDDLNGNMTENKQSKRGVNLNTLEAGKHAAGSVVTSNSNATHGEQNKR